MCGKSGGRPVSMAAWAGKTPSGVRINFVYRPQLRGRRLRDGVWSPGDPQQLFERQRVCWLYTDFARAPPPRIF